MKQVITQQSGTDNATGLLNQKNTNLALQTAGSPQLPTIAGAPSLDPITKSRIESLKQKKRADSFLASLTEEQMNQIYDWFIEFEDLGTVYPLVTAPPPEGLGLQVSLRTLRRFRSSIRSLSTIHTTEDILDTITDMEQDADLTQSSRIQNAMIHLLHEHAFGLARNHPGCDSLRGIVTTIQKLSTIEFQRQKLALERERVLHQINAPSTPRHHRVDLNIVPPKQEPAGTLSSIPEPTTGPQQLPPVCESRA